MIKLLTLLLSLTFLGCASPVQPLKSLTIQSGDFSNEEIEVIIAVADEWCAKSGRCVGISIGDSKKGGWIGKGRPESRRCKKHSGFTRLSPTHAPRIHLCSDALRSLETLWMITAHELGHAHAGRMGHLSKGNVISNELPWKHPGIARITEEDVRYVDGL